MYSYIIPRLFWAVNEDPNRLAVYFLILESVHYDIALSKFKTDRKPGAKPKAPTAYGAGPSGCKGR
jgi:hypothetical protein